MNDDLFSNLHIYWLLLALFVLLLLSAFFSGSETGLMALNPYRLKHLAKTNRTARLISDMLKRPDRLLGIILIGNNFANISASAIATIIGMRLMGDLGVLVATVSLTIILLIFSEVLPKTLGALQSRVVAMLAIWPLRYLLWLLFPLVWLVNGFSNGILRLFGVKEQGKQEALSIEELRTVVMDASGLVPVRHKKMLTNILDLEKLTVDDVMIPRTEIKGINLEDDYKEIKTSLINCQHTLVLAYRGELENALGIIHMRDVSKILLRKEYDLLNELEKICQKPYFIPEGTPLHQQLINFQHNKKRVALIVDEYGDILGLVTLADILEEIVGEFTTDVATSHKKIELQKDGTYLVDGSVNLRALNRTMGWDLPTAEAKTLSGLIIDYLESIPEANTGVSLGDYMIEILDVQDNTIKAVKILQQKDE